MAALTSPQSRWRRHKGPGASIQQQQPPSLSAGRLADSRTATQPGSINFLPPYPHPHPTPPFPLVPSFLRPTLPSSVTSPYPLLCVCVCMCLLLPSFLSPSPSLFAPLHLHPLRLLPTNQLPPFVPRTPRTARSQSRYL